MDIYSTYLAGNGSNIHQYTLCTSTIIASRICTRDYTLSNAIYSGKTLLHTNCTHFNCSLSTSLGILRINQKFNFHVLSNNIPIDKDYKCSCCGKWCTGLSGKVCSFFLPRSIMLNNSYIKNRLCSNCNAESKGSRSCCRLWDNSLINISNKSSNSFRTPHISHSLESKLNIIHNYALSY